MNRRFTSFLAMLLLMLTALPMSAQLEEFHLKKVSIGAPAETMTPDTQWYLVWNKRGNNDLGGYWEDKGTSQGAYVSPNTDVIIDGDFADQKCQYLVRFVSTDEEGKYRIQFGTGNYLQGRTGNGAMTITASESGAGAFNVYNINGEPEHFGINVWNMAACVDQNGAGNTVATWSTGEITQTGGNNDFTLYAIGFVESSDYELQISLLAACVDKYQERLPEIGNDPFDRGSDIGQYNCTDEEFDFFASNLLRGWNILNETESATADEIKTIIQNIETGHQAIIASLVPLTIADGNYRIVSALEWTKTVRIDTGELDIDDNPIYDEIVTHPTKAMYATLEGKAMWADIDSTDCRYLWKLTNAADGNLQMMNIATDGILHSCTQSAQATLTNDSETVMHFEFIQRNEEGQVVVAMRPSQSGGYGFLHANGHGGGSGNASNIVGWSADAGATQWILQAVTDEEVNELVEAYAPIKNHELLVSMFQETITEAEAAIAKAKDTQYIMERKALLTSTDQFSSPFTDPTEGSLANVLNDDANSYWHSTWQEGNKQSHDHYFQVALAEVTENDIQCFIRRRNSDSDHITRLGIFGANDEAALEDMTEDSWTNLGAWDLPNASRAATTYSEILSLSEGYQYFRFYIDGTTNNRGYGHFATFQLYDVKVDGNTQWSQMGEAATSMEEALATAKAVDTDEVSIDEYNDLKEALEAFKAVLCDPAALAAAIEANKNVADAVLVGTEPGFWSEESEVGAISETLKEATAYLKSGAYTQDQLDAYTAAITKGAKDIFSAAIPVEEGKWYAIKFDSEERYEEYGWNKNNVVNETLGDLYNNYLAPANVEDEAIVPFEALEEVRIGQHTRFINEDDIQSIDQIAFRFVAQGDSAFVIQHKSGLYLNGNTAGNGISLGLTPALFNVEAIGLGKVLIKTRNMKGQSFQANGNTLYLHAQNAGHSLVTWTSSEVGSNSALLIETIDPSDLEGEDIAEGITYAIKPNSMKIVTFASAFTVGEGAKLYAYQGAINGEEEVHFAFNEVEQANPGQPVLLVVGDVAEFDPEAEMDEEEDFITIQAIGTTFACEPDTIGGIHGTFGYQWVDKGTVVVGGGEIAREGDKLVLADGEDNTDCTRDISGNTGYIVYTQNILKDATTDSYDLCFTIAMQPVAPGIKGDVTGDGAVTIQDVVAVLEVMANDSNDPAADVNGDEAVTIQDVVAVLEIMAAQ